LIDNQILSLDCQSVQACQIKSTGVNILN